MTYILTTITDPSTGDIRYLDEHGNTVDVNICDVINSCPIESLSNVSGIAASINDVLTWDGSIWVPASPSGGSGSSFVCSDLNSCSIDSLSDVDAASPSIGNVLAWDSIAWSKSTVCSLLNSCSVDNVGNITITAPASGQVLKYDGSGDWVNADENLTSLSGLATGILEYVDEAGNTNNINICTVIGGCSINSLSDVNAGAAISGQILKFNGNLWLAGADDAGTGSYSFTISDGTTTQVINDTNTLMFSGSGGIQATVSATDTVSYRFNETVTAISGTGSIIRYTDESGATTDIDICSSIGSCSVNSLSDINTSSAVSGQILRFNGNLWAPTADSVGGGSYSFTISDSSNTQTIDDGNVLTFSGKGNLSVAVSATDTVTYTFNEYITGLSSLGNGSIRYNKEDGTNDDISICTVLNSCSINSLSDVNVTTISPTAGNVLTYSGAGGSARWIPDTPTVAATISVSGNSCVNISGDGSPGDPLSVKSIISPAKTIAGNEFSNSLTCTDSGLFVPCIEFFAPTAATPHDPFTIRIPCDGTFTDIDIQQNEILFSSLFVNGDPVVSGGDIYINTNDISLFVRDGASITRAQGTYGYTESISVTGTPQNINHFLYADYVQVQLWKSGALQDTSTFTITITDSTQIKVSSATATGTHVVTVLPVYTI